MSGFLQRLTLSGASLLCATLAFPSPLPPEGGYHLVKRYELGAAPGGKEYWDYITFDPGTRRLYISHNTEVKVVDADSGQILGSIADLKRVHGMAIVGELGRGYLVETVKTEFGARNMAMDPKTHLLFISSADFTPAAAPTAEQPHPQPTPIPGTFRLLVYGR